MSQLSVGTTITEKRGNQLLILTTHIFFFERRALQFPVKSKRCSHIWIYSSKLKSFRNSCVLRIYLREHVRVFGSQWFTWAYKRVLHLLFVTKFLVVRKKHKLSIVQPNAIFSSLVEELVLIVRKTLPTSSIQQLHLSTSIHLNS